MALSRFRDLTVTECVRWYGGMAFVLALAAAVRLWGLGAAGYANTYYSAAALSMSRDPVAFLFGSLDTQNFITVDKPAIGLWPQAIAVRLFGLNQATAVLPSVLFGVASVGVLALVVRRGFGGDSWAGLLAALGLAISPITVALDRDTLPDPLMILLLLLAALALLDAVHSGRIWLLAVSGALVGLAFGVKMLQAYAVLPAFVVTWLLCADTPIRRRLLGLVAAVGALVAVSAAWPAALYLVPAERRPFIGGSTDGTALDLVFGGVTRVVGGGAVQNPSAAFSLTEPGPGRLFGGLLVDQIGWWLPLALLSLVTLLPGRRPGPVLFAGWTLVLGVLFSTMSGIFHPYYTAQLAPAVCALAGMGLATGVTAVQVVAGTGGVCWALYASEATRPGWLLPVIMAAGVLALVLLAVGRRALAAGCTAIALLAGPLTWTALTPGQPVVPANPLANDAHRNPLIPQPITEGDRRLAGYLLANRHGERWIAASLTAKAAGSLIVAARGEPVLAIGGFTGTDPVPSKARLIELIRRRELRFVELDASWGGRGLTPDQLGWSARQRDMELKAAERKKKAMARTGVIDWVRRTCTPVDPRAYGGVPPAQLFDCGGAT
ncbi:hypothetical protein D5S17_07655 [Pseudonocardiaceae bacterium YIM PH 21723]|nr:hypothetical protein D5S17_07655 [Pseudonocardiaceae bacterium YIM PH 21723]